MPPLPPTKSLRRKRTSPTAIVGNEQIGPWIRKFEANLEQGRRKSAKTTAVAAMNGTTSSKLQLEDSHDTPTMEPKVTFFDLPREVQSAIVKEVSLSSLGLRWVGRLLCV